jgi:RimJ/RimL family protein N-acetyltransferase
MRGHTLDDFPNVRAMWSDPAVTFHISGQPMIEEDIWMRFLRHAGHWSLMGFGNWIIEEKASGRFVGETGLFDAKRNMQPSLGEAHEAGWAFVAWAHGKGYASEATQAAHAWHDKQFDRARTACMIAPGNGPSLRVAEKLGYREFARTNYKGHDAILFERVER